MLVNVLMMYLCVCVYVNSDVYYLFTHESTHSCSSLLLPVLTNKYYSSSSLGVVVHVVSSTLTYMTLNGLISYTSGELLSSDASVDGAYTTTYLSLGTSNKNSEDVIEFVVDGRS